MKVIFTKIQLQLWFPAVINNFRYESSSKMGSAKELLILNKSCKCSNNFDFDIGILVSWFYHNDLMRLFQCLHSLMTDWPFVARTKRLLFILSGKVMEQVMVNQYLAVPVTKEAKNTRRLLHLRWWDSAE